MLLLASTSDLIQVINDVTGTIDVHASYIDYLSGAITPGRKNTAITTNATTTVVASPTGSTVRNVKTLVIRNTHASTAVTITVQHYDGTTTVSLHKEMLCPGSELHFIEGQGFVNRSYISEAMPNWMGVVVAAMGDGDPDAAYRNAVQGGSVGVLTTNMNTTFARCSFFKLKKTITVAKARYYGHAAISAVMAMAVYDGDTGVRLTSSTSFDVAANAWGSVALSITLTAGKSYFLAVSNNNTTGGEIMRCCGASAAGTTGAISPIPRHLWPSLLASAPGNMNADYGALPFHQFCLMTITAGALPDPAAGLVYNTGTGGFPLIFLDSSNA